MTTTHFVFYILNVYHTIRQDFLINNIDLSYLTFIISGTCIMYIVPSKPMLKRNLIYKTKRYYKYTMP